MSHFHSLPARTRHEGALPLARHDPHVTPDDPATSVFTDLRIAASVVVPGGEPLQAAHRLMQLAGVRMAFVVDGAGAVSGLVTAADLQGERPTLAADARQIGHGELTVEHVASPLAQWPSVDIGMLERARVGDIVATFQTTGRRYLLVTETVAGAAWPTRLCGLFSANRTERALGTAIDPELRSRSFSELAAALAHG